MEKEIWVYLDRKNTPVLVGRLWARTRKQIQSASFEYDTNWLKDPECFALEPALMQGVGTYHTESGKHIFASLGDSAPDRWGRVLMRRAERLRALDVGELPHTLMEVDYLLRVNDEARMGALRFSEQKEGPFLAENHHTPIPPLIDLPRLLSASQHVSTDSDSNEDLRLLLAPGSSLGGARPKASVRGKHSELLIAKFPLAQDEISVVLWEALAFKLASQCGICVPNHEIKIINNKPILLSKRFDRNGSERIPFLSAMSMLNVSDNEPGSYMEIADALSQYGAAPKADLHQLWRRILFNILIANTDDHLRNHAFLYEPKKGWRLSPAYDLNPVPLDIKPRILTTHIDLHDGEGTIEHALDVAEYFSLEYLDAKKIANEMQKIISHWHLEAAALGIKKQEISRMRSAFFT